MKGFYLPIQSTFIGLFRLFLLDLLLLSLIFLELCALHPSVQIYGHKVVHDTPFCLLVGTAEACSFHWSPSGSTLGVVDPRRMLILHSALVSSWFAFRPQLTVSEQRACSVPANVPSRPGPWSVTCPLAVPRSERGFPLCVPLRVLLQFDLG